MNRQRREDIRRVIDSLSELSQSDVIQDALADIENIRDDEQEYLDVMPEGLRYSERGQLAEEAVSALTDALDALTDMVDTFDNVVGDLERAAE